MGERSGEGGVEEEGGREEGRGEGRVKAERVDGS